MSTPSTPSLRSIAARYALVALVCATAGALALTFIGATGPSARVPAFEGWPVFQMWIRWDAGWYYAIAKDGYFFSDQEQSSAAFFPLYPLLLRSLMALGANPYYAGMAVTFVCGLGAVLAFSRWASLFAPAPDVRRAVALLLVWPFAYYLVAAMYSDALFLLLTVTAFWRLEREDRVGATLLGALATATRPVAPALVLGLLIRSLELARRENRALRPLDFLPALSVAGLLAYMTHLGLTFGDPLAFLHAQSAWQQTPGPRAWFKLELLRHLDKPQDLLIPLLHAALAFTLLGMVPRVRRTLGWGYAVYVAIALGMPLLSSRDFIGLGRYGLAAFPSFLALSTALAPRPRLTWAWLVGSSALLLYAVCRYAMGSYIS